MKESRSSTPKDDMVTHQASNFTGIADVLLQLGQQLSGNSRFLVRRPVRAIASRVERDWRI